MSFDLRRPVHMAAIQPDQEVWTEDRRRAHRIHGLGHPDAGEECRDFSKA